MYARKRCAGLEVPHQNGSIHAAAGQPLPGPVKIAKKAGLLVCAVGSGFSDPLAMSQRWMTPLCSSVVANVFPSAENAMLFAKLSTPVVRPAFATVGHIPETDLVCAS